MKTRGIVRFYFYLAWGIVFLTGLLSFEALAENIQIKMALSRPFHRDEMAKNIYTIYVYVAQSPDQETEPYNIVYYFDGRFVKSYDGVRLPYEFNRNFRAQNIGRHEISVNLQDIKSKQFISSASMDINVE